MRAWAKILTVSAAVLAGCGGVSGEVDGLRVGGMEDALFDRFELLGVDLVFLWLSDVPDSCDAFDEAFEAGGSCEETCEELGAVAETYLTGDEHWALSTTMRIGGDVEGTYSYDDDVLLGEDGFTAEFFRWDVSLWSDYDRCVDECQEGDALTGSDSEPADGGTVEITAGDDAEVAGTLSMTFDDGGELDGSFTASRCEMADWLSR